MGKNMGRDTAVCLFFAYAHGWAHGLVHERVAMFRMLTWFEKLPHGRVTPVSKISNLPLNNLGYFSCDSVL